MNNPTRPLRKSVALQPSAVADDVARKEFELAVNLLVRKFVALRSAAVPGATAAVTTIACQTPEGDSVTVTVASGAMAKPALEAVQALVTQMDGLRGGNETQPDVLAADDAKKLH